MSLDGQTTLNERRRRLAAAFAFSRHAVGPMGWVWVFLVLFLLFYPFSHTGSAPLWKAILPYGLHACMWAGLVWSFWPLACVRRGGRGLLFILLVAAGGLSELVQGGIGRTPEWLDWGMDALGAGMASLYACGWRKTGLALAAALGGGLIAVLAFRMAEEWHAYPVLADASNRWSRYRWECNGVRLRAGKKHLRAVCNRGDSVPWPGIFRAPLRRDWSGTDGLVLEIHWPSKNGGCGMLGVRIDDRPDNPPYNDRWQMEVPVTNGWNTLILSDSWLRTPSGREMEDSHIRSWGVFVVSAPKTNWFTLRTARLITTPPSAP